ncbi:phospholipase D-like domain-containing protein [uncultured Thiodictyon sp.]|uniref:phospholipase D-like domain-containing protein n=1 Tax=uncultured Thiodictyon sp. TaxID=1846217 RepID=UPI002601332A|nr:phospholipase D-like domain-containing protein [uncultured Thiodictyon sp.]
MSPMCDWQTLTQGLTAALDGRQVTHALFTTYCFEPEFFETSVVPALLPEAPALSVHSGLRRLQLERYLHRHPLPIDVYFDAGVALPGVPWLPYRALPVGIDGAFHGKVVLLRTASLGRVQRIRWVLGAGSANLTRAGWWENIEVFHFVPAFDPEAPPAAVLSGLSTLLEFLQQTRRRPPPPESATAILAGELAARPTTGRGDTSKARFEVFLPGPEQGRFAGSLATALGRRGERADQVEVISPYFPTETPGALVKELLDAAGGKQVHLWLPQDPWHRSGTAVRMAEADYRALRDEPAAHWCRFGNPELREQATPEDPPATAVRRFLHAKVIRVPGRVGFIGSVNFSRAAFDRNFEAGFWFADQDAPWLETLPDGGAPDCFTPEPEASLLDQGDAAHPRLLASYHWGRRSLGVELLAPFARLACGSPIELIPTDGSPVPLKLDRRMRLKPATAARIEAALKTQPWLRVRWSKDAPPLSVWVDQAGLQYRPPPAELSLGLWRILDLWRGLDPAHPGSDPDWTSAIEIALSRDGAVQGEDPPPPAGPREDLFEQMSSVHAGLHLLRTRLLAAKEDGDRDTLRYYLRHQRPDTLPTLLDRLDQGDAESATQRPDLVERWAILHWVQQIAEDHSEKLSQGLKARVAEGLVRLAQDPDMAALAAAHPGWLEWVAEMFLCPLGQEERRSRAHRRRAAPHG